jgi:Xaa-Pro aminopeptidase
MRITAENFKQVDAIIEKYADQLDFGVKIPSSEYEQRYEKTWKKMEKLGIDVGFFYWYREYPGDGVYLTGYNPTLERASGVIAVGKRPLLLVGPESGLLNKETGLNLEARFVEEFTFPGEYYEGVTLEKIADVVPSYVGKPIKTIGYMTAYDYIPCEYFEVFTKHLAPQAKVVDATNILIDLRYEKSEAEFKCMKQADIIASAGVRAMLAVTKPGLRELQIAAVADYVVKSLGGDGYGFETIVNSGQRCSMVIGPATNKIIKEGEIVQIGCCPSYQCYKGICRRAFVAGSRSKIQEQYFEFLNEGYRRAEEELRNVAKNNLPSNRIDLAAREFFKTQEINGKNMAAYHFFSSAHGTGLTECAEKQLIHPYKEIYYGNNIGVMIDLGVYLYPDESICGGTVENAFFKRGAEIERITDVPDDVQGLVGKGL